MFSRMHRSLAVLALGALAACSGPGSRSTIVPLPPTNVPNSGLTQQNYVAIGDSLTAGEQSNGLLGDPGATSSVSALPGGIVPPTQENGWFALFYQQATGNSATGVLPLIKAPGLLSQMVVSAQPPGFVATHSPCDTFNAAAYSPENWIATRMNPAAAIANLGVPGITMHEAVSMTHPLTGPAAPPNCGFVTIPGDPTSGGLQALVGAESTSFYPILGQFTTTLPAGSVTQLNAAVSLHPQLTTVWLGANDLLKYIFSHGSSPATDSPQQFAADLTQIVTTLKASGSKVLVANLPHVLGEPGVEGPSPQFFPIAKVGADLTAISGGKISAAAGAQIQGYLQATYTGSGGFLTESGFFSVVSQLLTNPTALPSLDPNGAGSGDGALYLDTTFAMQAMGLNDAYNTAIAQVVSQTGATLVDVESTFDTLDKNGLPLAPGVTLTMQFGGGLLSYDGLHPSNTAYAALANLFIGTADAALGMSIPPLSNAQIGAIAQSDTYNPFVIKAVNPQWPYPLP